MRTSGVPANVALIRSTDPPVDAEEVRCLGSDPVHLRAEAQREARPA
jgi:hypothetical protein